MKNGALRLGLMGLSTALEHINSTEVDAANAYAWVQADRRTSETRLVKVPKDAEKSVKKTLRAANLIIVKSSIKFDGKGKPTLHDNVKLIRDRLLENAGGGP